MSAGRTCRLEKCGFNSKDHVEFEAHLLNHKEDLKRRLICNQVGCLAAMVTLVFLTCLVGRMWGANGKPESVARACGRAQG